MERSQPAQATLVVQLGSRGQIVTREKVADRNQRTIALLEGCIRIAVCSPGTVDLRPQCHIDGAPVSGDIIHGFRVHRHYPRVVNIGAV